MKRLIYLLLFLINYPSFGQNFQSGFHFYLAPFDSTTQRFLPQFNQKAITNTEFVSIDNNGHFSVNGNRMRFWGGNLSVNGTMPLKTDAPSIAGRLRKSGVNIVRIGDIDRNGLIFTYEESTRHLNPYHLDLLEYFISQLKSKGIYIDLVSLAGRVFNAQDSVPESDSLYLNLATLFDPQLIMLQKEFLKSLLTHTNPYTGLTLARDPVLATMEITNENSLFSFWLSNMLQPYSMNGKLTIRHNQMLEDMWNNYLIKKYNTTQALDSAWANTDSSAIKNNANMIANGGFENTNISDNWSFYKNSSTDVAEISRDTTVFHNGKSSAKINIQSTSGIGWHIQLCQLGLSLTNKKTYQIEFYARSDSGKTIGLEIGQQSSPFTVYWYKDVTISRQWKKYAYTFSLDESQPNDVQLVFQLGQDTSNFYLDDVSLRQITKWGLKDGESLESKNVHRMYHGEIQDYTDKRVSDLTKFFIDLQLDYFNTMRDYLRNDLGVKTPITSTNWTQGLPDIKIQGQYDYIDVHQYWDLVPDNNYTNGFANSSMINNPATSTIYNFAGKPIKNKPFTISEYNHPFPNRYQIEAPFFLAGYGSFIDADALMMFNFSDADSWRNDFIASWFPFNIGSHNIIMSLMPSFGYAYRYGLISPASKSLDVNFSDSDVYNSVETTNNYPKAFDPKLMLTHNVRIASLSALKNYSASDYPAASANPYVSDNNQLYWDSTGIFKINTPKFIGFVGFLNNFTNEQIGDMKIISADKFAGITWLSLNNDSLRNSSMSLLTIGTRQINSNMVWPDTKHVTNWGGAPSLIEPTTLTLQLTINADSIRVVQLGTKGEETENKTVYYPQSGNLFTITINQSASPSLWFGIETKWNGIKQHQITLLQPASQSEFKQGSTCPIQWEKENVDSIQIAYSINHGKDWITIANKVEAKSGAYTWIVPAIDNDSCLIKISDATDTSTKAISKPFMVNNNMLYNGKFLYGTIYWDMIMSLDNFARMDTLDGWLTTNIQVPGSVLWNIRIKQSNLTFEKGKTYDLSFDAKADKARTIGVEFAGSKSYYENEFDLTTTRNTYSTSFTMPDTTDNSSLLSFYMGNDNTNVQFDNIFLQEHSKTKALDITAPTNKDCLSANSVYNIQWTSQNVDKVNLYYKTTLQSAWTSINSNITASDGKYAWTIPQIKNDSCVIKIEDAANTAFYQLSPAFYIQVITAIDIHTISSESILLQSNLNPLEGSAIITYTVPSQINSTNHIWVDLKVYNVLGLEIASLFKGYQTAGIYHVTFNASSLPKGVYLCRLNEGFYTKDLKLIVK